jgi:hypothetical protein
MPTWEERLDQVASAGPDRQAAGTGPTPEELFGTDPRPSRELASAALTQMGEPALPGYGPHRVPDLPDVSGLRDRLALEDWGLR